jgi:hypothetical protein
MTSIVESKIHEPRIFAGTSPACLNGIDVHTRAGIAEHEFLRSSILRGSILNPEEFGVDDYSYAIRKRRCSF